MPVRVDDTTHCREASSDTERASNERDTYRPFDDVSASFRAAGFEFRSEKTPCGAARLEADRWRE
jgi:hypothetical protein